jgi:hypothetical protein
MIGWLKFVADAKDLGFDVAEDAEAFASSGPHSFGRS